MSARAKFIKANTLKADDLILYGGKVHRVKSVALIGEGPRYIITTDRRTLYAPNGWASFVAANVDGTPLRLREHRTGPQEVEDVECSNLRQ